MRKRLTTFTRGQRQWRPVPTDEVRLPGYPPAPAQPSRVPAWLLIAPVSGVFVMALVMAFAYGNLIFPLAIGGASLIYPLVMVARQKQQEKQFQAERAKIEQAYARRVDDVHQQLISLQRQQAESLHFTYPSPRELLEWLESGSPRPWERRPGDADFLDLRLGTGRVPASFSLRLPGVEIPELAPQQLLEARDRLRQLLEIPDLPITARLRELGSLAVTGPRSMREGLSRSLLCGLAALHAPVDLEVYAVYAANRVEEWSWLKWLPHTRALEGGSAPHLAYEPSGVRQLISGLLDELRVREVHPAQGAGAGRPALVLLLADQELIRGEATLQYLLRKGPSLGAYLILLTANPQEVPEGCAAHIDVADPHHGTFHPGGRSAPRPLLPDLTEASLAERIARALAPMRAAGGTELEDLPDEVRLLDLMGAGDPQDIDLEARWLRALSAPPSLETPLGMRHGHRPLVVDLRQSGQGPHGLIAGTTGSGKSELLLSLLAGLALNHHPHQVNFVLVDYKGGTSMSLLQDLPHTVGVVTDLDGKQTRRALIALRSEMARREEMLARYQVADIDKYHALGHREPFPYLFIVIDEFAELKEHFKNDLADILREFVSVAQKGRALGVHLILAMQKPEGVVNDSIRANMKFRACLRVERAEDSRNVLGRPDAYLLPARPPGRAYFQVGKDEQFDLFQVARVAGFHSPVGEEAAEARRLVIAEVGPDGRRLPLLEVGEQTAPPSKPAQGRTEAQVLVERAVQAAGRMGLKRLPSPWPPPLPPLLPLPTLFQAAGLRGWDGSAWPPEREAVTGLPAPVALLDQPVHQRQTPFVVDLVQDGNLLVVGAPGSGRTTFALTLITSLALLFPPDRVHFHLIDFGGHQLQAAFSKFPHVAGIYAPNQSERIRRLLSTLEAELEERKERFGRVGAASLAGYRQAVGGAEALPAIVVLIHNLSGFQEAFADGLSGWTQLLRGGAAYGIYFVLTSDRLPLARLADLIPQRMTLRLTDPTWYAVILGSRPDLNTFDPVPGRGFVGARPPEELQVALPTEAPADGQLAVLQDLGKRMSRVWRGSRPSPIRLLGNEVSLGTVLPTEVLERWPLNRGPEVPIGLDDLHLKPVLVDLARRGPHLLVSGAPEGGKTTALLALGLSLAACNDSVRLHLAIIAPNRSERIPLSALGRLPHTVGFARTEGETEALISTLEALAANVKTTEAAAEREATVLLIDDYHLLANRLSAGTVARLEALVRQGADLSLTTLITAPASALTGIGDNILRQFKAGRSGLWLKSSDATDSLMAGLRMPSALKGKTLPPGRGVLYGPSDSIVLQVVAPEVREEEGRFPQGAEAWVEAIRAAAARRLPGANR
ncbi:MAG: FtsK/SpoIIIE domain-containing protein [Chloroflexota bacterium]